jgi:hypothetical protein
MSNSLDKNTSDDLLIAFQSMVSNAFFVSDQRMAAGEDVNVKTEIQIDSVRTISFEKFSQMEGRTFDENLKSECEQHDSKHIIKQEQLTESFEDTNEDVMVRSLVSD